MFLKALEEYILLDIGDYFEGVSFPINIFILSICLGLCIAAFIVTVHKRYIYTALYSMLRHGAVGKENAKTLKELRLEEVRFLKNALSRQGQLTYVVKKVEDGSSAPEDEGESIADAKAEDTVTDDENAVPVSNKNEKKGLTDDDKINFDKARFYIDENKISRARQLTEKDAPGYFAATTWSLLIMSLAFVLTLFMQDILSFLSGLI